ADYQEQGREILCPSSEPGRWPDHRPADLRDFGRGRRYVGGTRSHRPLPGPPSCRQDSMKPRKHAARPVILAHGGAGLKPMTPAQEECLRLALVTGYDLLRRGVAAIDAVQEAIRTMESSGLFNAGRGSRLQLDGARRMDAALMEGRQLRAGAVAGIEQVRHPI